MYWIETSDCEKSYVQDSKKRPRNQFSLRRLLPGIDCPPALQNPADRLALMDGETVVAEADLAY